MSTARINNYYFKALFLEHVHTVGSNNHGINFRITGSRKNISPLAYIVFKKPKYLEERVSPSVERNSSLCCVLF